MLLTSRHPASRSLVEDTGDYGAERRLGWNLRHRAVPWCRLCQYTVSAKLPFEQPADIRTRANHCQDASEQPICR